jgi:uncharacterized membrane protein
MNDYTLLLFVHVLAAMAWVGGGILLHLISERAVKAQDPGRIRALLDDAEMLGKRFFGPVTGLTLLFGILLVFNGDWGWDHVFILGGLAGIVLSAILGFGMIQPAATKVLADLEASGGVLDDKVNAGLKKIQMVSRVDLLVLVVVVFLMTVKPGS